MIWENLQLAFMALISNKMRALLTMLGIIIGIMSIITIMIIGDALNSAVSGELAGLGGNSIFVNLQERTPEREAADPNDPFGMAMGPMSLTGRSPLSEDRISAQMIADMRAYFPDEIIGVSLSRGVGRAQARDLERFADVTVSGVNPDYFIENNLVLVAGRLIDDLDYSERAMTAVVSDRLVERMFVNGVDPIGQQIRLFRPNLIEVYTIVGVYTFEPSILMGDFTPDENAPTTFYIPLSTAMHGLMERNFTSMTVLGSPNTDIHSLTDALQAYFNRVYENNEFWRIAVLNMASILDAVASTLGAISLAIAFIASISLLVGGIGVMNIMLVSVTERTREIGTRKALGAKNFHIRLQFVVESLIIALVGGIIGMVLGIGIGWVITGVFEVSLVVSPVVVVGSMLFSMSIGVFFGIYPANKAAKLDPIDALRYE